jgi:signal transduction histidine kinase/CheY-like chemotaxis protein
VALSEPKPHARSLRARLFLLAIVILVPATAAGAALLFNEYRQLRGAAEQELLSTAKALSLVLDRQFGQDRVALDALAQSPSLMSGDIRAFDAQARATLASLNGSVVLLDDAGHQLLNTRLPAGTDLPDIGLTSVNVNWTELTPNLRLSDVFTASFLNAPAILMERLVPLPGRPPLHLVLTMPTTAFAGIFSDQHFPPDWIGGILDSRGFIVARSRDSERAVGHPAPPEMFQRLARSNAGVFESRSLEGTPTVAGYSRLPDYGWTVGVAITRQSLVGGTLRNLGWGVALMALLLIGSIALAFWMARTIAKPVEGLAAAARAWEARAPIPVARSGMRELDELANALDDAIRSVERKEFELRQLNASLETRVSERSRELQDANDRLLHGQKLEAMGQLTGGIAHDFNNLLMVIRGNIDLLAARVADEKLLRGIDYARQACERGAKLTSQLLAFSRKQRLNVEAFDVAAAVQNTAELLRRTLGGTITVTVRMAEPLWSALADTTQLELMLLNLAINARDAMPGGGTLLIEADNCKITHAASRPESPPIGEYVRISLTDTGTGMPPAILARVFEPFFTTKAVGQGSGLGLSQVLGTAKQLGGGIELETQIGRGTTVRVFLPRAQAGVAKAAPAPRASASLPPGTRILAVDDDAEVRRVTAEALGAMGCEVREAESGEACLEMLNQDPRFDLILLDFAMPGLNGTDTARRIRESHDRIPILIMTGYAQALAESWDGPLIEKPCTALMLKERIAELLAKPA